MTPLWILAIVLSQASLGRPSDAESLLLQEADRLAWSKAWVRAAPLYAKAARVFRERGDEATAIYADVSRLRGELHRRAPLEVSDTIASYLELPVVQRGSRVRLRCLVIKGETDEDIDPVRAERSWREALEVATALNEKGWANRARGELGVVAFMQGDLNTAIVQLGRALKVAEAEGDLPSLVRWRTLYGHGYMHLKRPEQALAMYELALETAEEVPELRSVMTLFGKADALVALGRLTEAEDLLRRTLATASDAGSPGYQAEATRKLAELADGRGDNLEALRLFSRARTLAIQVGANRILAAIALARASSEIRENRVKDAAATLSEGIRAARLAGERLVLPKLLGQLAAVRSAQGRFHDAANLLDEAQTLAESWLTNASSPWLRSQLVGAVLNDVFVARIQLAGRAGSTPQQLFAAIEQPRARSVNDLLLSARTTNAGRPITMPTGVASAEREIARLQLRLYRTNNRQQRERILRQIFLAEERLAPASTELFGRLRMRRHRPAALEAVQRVLHADEMLLEYALADTTSFCLAVTSSSARVHRLPASPVISLAVQKLLRNVNDETSVEDSARALGAILLDAIPELESKRHIIVSADGDLHQLPFDLLVASDGTALIRSHVVSYVPSASTLHILRESTTSQPLRTAFVVSTSPNASESTVEAAVSRGSYDVDITTLPLLPSGEDEARAVRDLLGPSDVTMLLGPDATEAAVKTQRLAEYQVLHFAVHGIVSTQYPDRSGLVVRPTDSEDGIFQAREVVWVPLRARLVSLSACNTARGAPRGQEGVSSLVRPFLAAGARSVVANLWDADDRFSLAVMRAFYGWLARGTEVSEALTLAKRDALDQFGPSAVPKFWSGLVVSGDGRTRIRALTDDVRKRSSR
jgi:CHAT domain-containing protein